MFKLNKHQTVFRALTLMRKLRKIVQSFPSKHSCVVDGISSKIIKLTESAINNYWTVLINQVMNTGILHDEFKTAKLIPI